MAATSFDVSTRRTFLHVQPRVLGGAPEVQHRAAGGAPEVQHRAGAGRPAPEPARTPRHAAGVRVRLSRTPVTFGSACAAPPKSRPATRSGGVPCAYPVLSHAACQRDPVTARACGCRDWQAHVYRLTSSVTRLTRRSEPVDVRVTLARGVPGHMA